MIKNINIKNIKKKNINFSYKSTIKTFIKKIKILINKKDINESKILFKKLQSFLDRKSGKLIHKNKSSRYISKISRKINLINK